MTQSANQCGATACLKETERMELAVIWIRQKIQPLVSEYGDVEAMPKLARCAIKSHEELQKKGITSYIFVLLRRHISRADEFDLMILSMISKYHELVNGDPAQENPRDYINIQDQCKEFAGTDTERQTITAHFYGLCQIKIRDLERAKPSIRRPDYADQSDEDFAKEVKELFPYAKI